MVAASIAAGPQGLLADFLERARRGLEPAEPLDGGADLLIADHDERSGPSAPLRPAAVLVPIVARATGPTMLLTVRAATLSHHAGQIAFPGGRLDPGDASHLDAALREATEEIGLDRARVTPLGYLDPYVSFTDFRIVPVVGLVEPPFELRPSPTEVADVFEVPLGFLMAPENHVFSEREWRGRLRRLVAMPWQDRNIWGITARIIKNLHDRLYPA